MCGAMGFPPPQGVSLVSWPRVVLGQGQLPNSLETGAAEVTLEMEAMGDDLKKGSPRRVRADLLLPSQRPSLSLSLSPCASSWVELGDD